MNRIYKVIWSKARGCYVVVSELAHQYGKKKTLSSRTGAFQQCLLAGTMALALTAASSTALAAEATRVANGDVVWGASGNTANSNPSGTKSGTATAFGGTATDTTANQYTTAATAENATAFGEGSRASGQNSTAFGQ